MWELEESSTAFRLGDGFVPQQKVKLLFHHCGDKVLFHPVSTITSIPDQLSTLFSLVL